METNVSTGLNETAVAQATTVNEVANNASAPICYGESLRGLVNLIKSGTVSEIRTGIYLGNNKCDSFVEGLFFSLPSFTNEYGELIDTSNLYLHFDYEGKETICFFIGCDKYFDFYVPVLDGQTTDGRKIIDGGETIHKDVIEEISLYGLADAYLDNYGEMLLRNEHKWQIGMGDPELVGNLLRVMEIPYIAEHLAQYKEGE